MPTYDAVVVGAGIIGAACALELSKAGLKVLVVERNEVASGATAAGMGHLVLLDDSEAQVALADYSLRLWREMSERLPQDCQYWQCGTVWVAADEEEFGEARRKQLSYRARGVEAQLLSETELLELEPNLRAGLAGGLLIAQDAAVRPASAARYLMACAGEMGCQALAGRRVTGISDDCLCLSDGSTISAGWVVIATGVDAVLLAPGLPVRARKGHILVADILPHFAQHQVIELGYIASTHGEQGDSISFNVRQRVASELLIGSSRQFGAGDGRVEPAILERILKCAVAYMPGLEKARLIESWAGFRASTPDGLPAIGPYGDSERVFVATGHEGLGATMAPGTARLIADEIVGRTPEIDPGPYRALRLM